MDTHGSAFEAARHAIADEIRSRRARLRMTQLQLAQQSGLSRTTLARLEAADKDTTFPDIIRICKALNTNPIEFMQSVQDTMNQYTGPNQKLV